jgi:calcineurin-like phosphoesterase family protein
MCKVYLYSDLHLGHKNMAIHRGFKSSEEHDEYIIKKWNSVVTKRDKVFILGDITMNKTKYYHLLKRLNGNKVFVLGNHDPIQQKIKSLLDYGTVAGIIKYRGIWLSHTPIHPQELRGKKNIHGHTHEKMVKKFLFFNDGRYINVSAEILDYTPIAFENIKNKY